MIDLERPPARLGPRTPLWVRVSLIWGGLVVLLVLLLIALSGTHGAGPAGLFLVLTVSGVAVAAFLTYLQRDYPWNLSRLETASISRGMPFADPEAGGRSPDAEERAARHRLRRGEITRAEYERIIAHRRFAHGEISVAEYHEIDRELKDSEPGPPPRG
jgi:Short C-terminal domain